MKRLADYVIERLVKCGIKHIFMITGRGILYLTDAVAKNAEIEAICTYHEQGASYAAMAYAAAKGEMSACLVSTGCAATNAVTAALCAYQDNLPVIFISGQNMLQETTRYTGVPIRTYGSQEADIITIVESITKYSIMIVDAKKIAYEMDRMLFYANEGRKGPVWIDIPLDIQNARIDENQLEHFIINSKCKKASSDEIKYVADQLDSAKRPVIFVGGGIRTSKAEKELEMLVLKLNIPVVLSTSAADIYGSGNQLSMGTVGSLGGSRTGNFVVQNADFILAIGTKLCSQTIGTEAYQFAREATLVMVDVDEVEHSKKGAKIDKLIISDAKEFLKTITLQDIKPCSFEWVEKCIYWKQLFSIKNENFVKELKTSNQIDLYQFADIMSTLLDDEATVITDAGFEELIVPSTVRFKAEQRCLFPAAQGAMGYAIPAILGAYYAGKQNIIVVVGDGSIMMNMQELVVIAQKNILVKIFVISNDMYAVIRRRQKDLFRKRTIGNDAMDGLAIPDFKKISDMAGFKYKKIERLDELKDGIEDVLKETESIICEVSSTPDQKYLHTSFTFNTKKRLVKCPLEDLSPPIDRDVFGREMIITTESDD